MGEIKRSWDVAALFLRLYALLLILIALPLSVGGAYLLSIGGSPYYLLCGILVLASGILLWRQRAEGALLFGLMLLATLAWALWEAGFDGWALMPRILAPAVMGAPLLLPSLRRKLIRRAPAWTGGGVAAAIALALATGAGLHNLVPPLTPADPLYQTGMATARASTMMPPAQATRGDWLNFGNDPGGSRFSPLTQIAPANVGRLAPAWTYPVEDASGTLETTPLKIGARLYLCSSANDVIALDAENGKQIWRFAAEVDRSKVPFPHCRGVAYYRTPGASGPCAERILTNTVDARLIALDARDGRRCRAFGADGQVSLLAGMGQVIPGYYHVTSAPTVIRGKIVLGGWVADNQHWGEPSGVIRAFDAVTGKLAWAWDMGRPDRQSEPPAGESYTRSTPNAWGPMSADESLGLVYVPTGNATPDYFGAQRRPFDDKYSSSTVALDAETGKPRWSFQTVHHDLWDYDVPAQPTLVDYPGPSGMVHALIQPTKSGELFILDRATGRPVRPVEERAAPQRGAVPEERLAPTQPVPIGLPSFRGAQLVEGDMWGITPLDQLWCRIKFREARYEGPFTPPGLTPSIVLPGYTGGMEWGGVAVDPGTHIAIVNSNRIPTYLRLITRAKADSLGLKPFTAQQAASANVGGPSPQAGTPYGVISGPFLSPLSVPCTRPPYGRLSAVDLVTGKLIWTNIFGTARDNGPLGIRSHLPLPLGTINLGGAVTTRSGLVFIGAAQDRYLRAYETATGKELWRGRLPRIGAASPITYISSASGRQFVVIASGGYDGLSAATGKFYLAAYALPTGGHSR